MPDSVADWVDLVNELYPTKHAADWDNVGLQVGDPAWPVARVLVALDVTSRVVAEATEVPDTLILAHHPLLFRPLTRLTPDSASGKVALAAARAGVSVLAAHTNLDVATDGAGTSDPVALVLGIGTGRSLTIEHEEPGIPSEGPAHGVGFGRVGELPRPLPLVEVARRIREELPAPHLRFAGDPDRLVRRIAVVGGAGDSLIPAARAAGADVFVTGDLRHHAVLDALEVGLALIDAGHHATEAAALPAWMERLGEAADARGLRAELVASRVSTVPWSNQGG